MGKGDHLISARTSYSRHGIYLDQNKVIHYSSTVLNKMQPGIVAIVSLEGFFQGNGYTIQMYPCRTYDREAGIERGQSRLGEDWHHVWLNNCEQFITWCIWGGNSPQINSLIAGAASGKI